MFVTRPVVLACALMCVGPSAVAADPLELVVRAGEHARKETPVRCELPLDRFGRSLDGGPRGVKLQDLGDGSTVLGQLDAAGARSARLTFLLPGETPARAERRFRLDPSTVAAAEGPWSLTGAEGGRLRLENRGRPVFRYNLTPVADPSFPHVLARSAYLHPVQTPSGALITGDFSKFHPHHRGFFLAYTKTRVGDLHPDFWNFQNGTGKVHFDHLDAAVAGPLTARIVSRHRWEATGKGAVLNERWEIEAYDVPGSPYWLFDLTATQQAVDEPLELLPYRYGGMAYRGAEPFVKGKLDVLTSAGLDRVKGDQTPARWVDLTGPVAEGSDRFGGAMILDHPSNPGHPTVARIHPTALPFFAYTPGHDVRLTIPADRPTVFRYRVVVHDGRPDAARNDRLWHDFAEPPRVSVGAMSRD